MSSDSRNRKKFEDEVLGVFAPNPAFDRARTEANMELVQVLAQFLVDHPSLRFGQALNSLGMLDPGTAMVEPQDMLKRAKKIIRRMNAQKD